MMSSQFGRHVTMCLVCQKCDDVWVSILWRYDDQNVVLYKKRPSDFGRNLTMRRPDFVSNDHLAQCWLGCCNQGATMGNRNGISWECRQSQHKTTGQSLWHEPLSARSELHSHPLAEQARACGSFPKAEGLEGPMAPIVTSDGYSWERKELHLSRVIFVLGARLSFSASFNLKNLALCVSSLRRVHAKIIQTMTTLLELCVSARAGTMNSLLKKKLHFSGSCLVQRPR